MQRDGIDVREEIVYLHEQISLKTFKIRKQIDKEMSKFYNGTIPWSPELQGYRNTVDYWTRILRTKTNVATSKNIIKRLLLKLFLYAGYYLSAADALVSLKQAWKD